MLSFGHYEMKASEATFPWVNINAVDIRSVTIFLYMLLNLLSNLLRNKDFATG